MVEMPGENGLGIKAHPLLIVGIIITVFPVISMWIPILKFVPGWVSAIGILLIIVGGIATVMDDGPKQQY